MYSLLLHNFKHGQLTIVVWSPDKTLDMLITASFLSVNLKHELVLWHEVLQIWTWTCWKQHPSWLLLLSILSFTLITILFVLVLYPAVFIHTVCNIMVWFSGFCAYCNQKQKTKKNKKQTAIPLHSPPSLFPISYYAQIIQILFLLCVYSIARLSHKPSWTGCISFRWH